MKWYHLNTGFNTGKFNMDFDLHLAEICKKDEAFFRLYRWKPYCISLGANQQFESVDLSFAEKENIDVVKRPTGGRAILHAEELTYSVILNPESLFSVKEIYKEINLALIEGLKLYDLKLEKAELENAQTDFNSFYMLEKSSACFASSAKCEIKFKGKKLIGSAQRKLGNKILQHGSILCGNFHKKIIDFLKISPSVIFELKKELDENTINLKSITENEIDYERLADSLVKGFKKFFNINFSDFENHNTGSSGLNFLQKEYL